MSLSATYSPGNFGLSFELFPPKTPAGELELFSQLVDLMTFQPSFVTCTYGAGGSTRDKTLDVVSRVKREYDCAVATHLTCVGATVDELRAYLHEADRRTVDYVVALRGDPPRGQAQFLRIPGGLSYANELVALIRREFPRYGIAVAGYPETHQEAPSPAADLANLKRKVEAGADVVITQLFYDNEDFFRFRERYERIGIRAPLVPGILPVTSLTQIQRITSLCGAKLPANFLKALETRRDDPAGQFEAGVEHATRQVQSLIDAGIPGIHFYVLNKSPATCRVLSDVKRPA